MTPDERYHELRTLTNAWKNKNMIKFHFLRTLKEAIRDAYADAAKLCEAGCEDKQCVDGCCHAKAIRARAAEVGQ